MKCTLFTYLFFSFRQNPFADCVKEYVHGIIVTQNLFRLELLVNLKLVIILHYLIAFLQRASPVRVWKVYMAACFLHNPLDIVSTLSYYM